MLTKALLLLKLFLFAAAPFGLLVGVGCCGVLAMVGALPDMPFSSAQGALAGLAIGGLAGLLFGISMTTILGVLHFSQTADPRVHHRRRVVVHGSSEKATSMCMAAIASIPNVNIEKDSSEFRVVAKKGMTWRSWGDLITCDIRSAGPNEQTIEIASRPLLRTTLVDYGSNLENVNAIVSSLVANGKCDVVDT